ncbi:MAG: YbbR-like domain-containing protein [Candidatus Thermochlorobacter sp.]
MVKQVWARVPAFFGSLLFALSLWLFVALSKQYVATFSLPVSIKMEGALQAVSSGLPKQVNVKVSGEGWKILAFYLTRAEWTIDLANELQKSTLIIETTPSAAQYIKPLPEALTVLEVQPAQLIVSLEKKIAKTVPLRLAQMIVPASGFVITDYTLKPDSVIVSGAASLVEPIEFWEVIPQSADLKGTFTTRAVVADNLSPYLSVTPSSVMLSGTADKLAQIELADVPIQLIGAPAVQTVTLIPNKLKLTIGGVVSDLEALRPEDIMVQVNYNDIVADTTGSLRAKVVLPKRLRLLRQYPEQLQYILRR